MLGPCGTKCQVHLQLLARHFGYKYSLQRVENKFLMMKMFANSESHTGCFVFNQPLKIKYPKMFDLVQDLLKIVGTCTACPASIVVGGDTNSL